MGEFIERMKARLFGVNALTILLLFIGAIFGLILLLFIIVSTLPSSSPVIRYAAFAILVIIIFFSRTIEPWQWGFEIYNITIFMMAFVFGIPLALGVTIFTFFLFPVSWAIKNPIDFFLTKNYIGPIVQTVVLAVISVIAGLLKIFAGESVSANLPLYYMATFIFADMIIGNYLRLKITPLPLYRIAVYSLIVLIINYNLVTRVGKSIMDLMVFLSG